MALHEATQAQTDAALDVPLLSALIHDGMHTAETILRDAPDGVDEVGLVATAFQMGAEMGLALALVTPDAGRDLLDAIETHVLHGDQVAIDEREHVIQAHYLHTIECDRVASGHGDDAP